MRVPLLCLALAASASASSTPFSASEALRRATTVDRSYNPLLLLGRATDGGCLNPTSTECPSGNGCARAGYTCCPDIDGVQCIQGQTCGPAGCCDRADGCPIVGPINVTAIANVPVAPETTAEVVKMDNTVTQADVNLDTQVQYTGPWETSTSACNATWLSHTVSSNGSALIVFDETVAGVSVYLGADPWAQLSLNFSNHPNDIGNSGAAARFVDGCKKPQYRWKFWQLPGVKNYLIIDWVPPLTGADVADPKVYLQRVVVFRTKEAVSNSIPATTTPNTTTTAGAGTGGAAASSNINTAIWGPPTTNVHSQTGGAGAGNATGTASAGGAGTSSAPHSGVGRSVVVSLGGGALALAAAAFVLL